MSACYACGKQVIVLKAGEYCHDCKTRYKRHDVCVKCQIRPVAQNNVCDVCLGAKAAPETKRSSLIGFHYVDVDGVQVALCDVCGYVPNPSQAKRECVMCRDHGPEARLLVDKFIKNNPEYLTHMAPLWRPDMLRIWDKIIP